MTYKHVGFSESIVMKELEKVAYRKNLIQNDPEPEKVVIKLASTDDLFLDTITLAAALRDNGFVKQAEKLEEKALQYKMASNDPNDTDKYHWWQEEGKALIDHSHEPDDYEEIPSSKGYGLVENQNEIHKILEQVVQHQPTGKAGSQNKEIVVMAINALGQYKLKEKALPGTLPAELEKRKAKASNFQVTRENLKSAKNIAEQTEQKDLIEKINDAINSANILDKIGYNDQIYHNQIRAGILPSSKMQNINIPGYDGMIQMINEKLSKIIEEKSKNPELFILANSLAELRSSKVYEQFMNVSKTTKEQQDKNLDSKLDEANKIIQNIVNEINSQYINVFQFLDDSKLKNIFQNLREVPKVNAKLEEINNDPLAVYLILGKNGKVSPITYSPDFSLINKRAIASIDNLNKIEKEKYGKENKDALKYKQKIEGGFEGMAPLEIIKFYTALNSQIAEYMQAYNEKYKEVPSGVEKVSFQYDNLIKNSFLPGGGTAAPATPSSGKGSAGPSQKKEPGRILSSEAVQAISNMQGLLKELATKSADRADTKFYVNTLNSASKDEGAWGVNTQRALDAVKQMISKGITGVESEMLESRPPLSAQADESIIDSANNNCKVIMQVMVVAFAENRYAVMAYAVTHLDNIPKTIDELSSADEKQGSIKIKENNLSSLYSLKKHLTSNGFSSGV